MSPTKSILTPTRSDYDLRVARVTLLLAESDTFALRAKRIRRIEPKPGDWRLLYRSCAERAIHLRTEAEMVSLRLGVDFTEAKALHETRRATARRRE